MARPPRRRARRSFDWVYRPDIWDESGNQVDSRGTYSPIIKSLTVGPSNALGLILYDSEERLTAGAAWTANNAPRQLIRAARAEGRRPFIKMVTGQFYVEPSAWAAGNVVALGMRIGIFEQTSDTGAIGIQSTYNMWSQTAANPWQPANFANDRKSRLWETRVMKTFNASTANSWVIPIRASINRTLGPEECLAIYLEGESTSVNMRLQSWLRTLIAD